MQGTATKQVRASRHEMPTMKPSVKRTWMTERRKTLTLSCTWSPTFWQSAERREVMSPVRTAEKKSSSCRSSEANRRCLSRTEKRPPMTMKVEPRNPVKTPVTRAVPTSSSMYCWNLPTSREIAIASMSWPYRKGIDVSPAAAMASDAYAKAIRCQSGFTIAKMARTDWTCLGPVRSRYAFLAASAGSSLFFCLPPARAAAPPSPAAAARRSSRLQRTCSPLDDTHPAASVSQNQTSAGAVPPVGREPEEEPSPRPDWSMRKRALSAL
mmetsp:Transcript_21057/g.68972  ORF Transcript_21057/g.68972 Transcript_21057/m.68972 type:complete len:268 (-) Transcript_21057:456-1259(-)